MSRKNVAGPIVGFLALIFCFISIACLSLKAWLVFWIFLILFVATLAVLAALHYQDFVNLFVSRQLRYGTNVALSVIGIIGIAVFVNVIVSQRFDMSLDLTELQDNSLSEQTKKILKSLNKDVEIIAFYSDENSQFAIRAMHKLELFQRESEFITVALKDPYIEVQKVDHRLRDGTIVFSSKDRQEEVTIVSEQKFASAVLKLIQNKTKKIYFLVGHGEYEINDLTQFGLSEFKKALENQNYEPITLSFLTEADIPSNCDLLAIVGPTETLTTNEIDKISRYIDKNGKLLLLFHPSESSEDVNKRLVQLMSKWEVSVGNDLVIDRFAFDVMRGSSAPFPKFEHHEITRQLDPYLAFPKTRSVSPKDDIKSELSVKSLAKTVSALGVSWAERERMPDGKFSGNGYTAGIDLPAPVSFAVAVEKHTALNTNDTDEISPTRIVVFGCSNFATNLDLKKANQGLLLTSVNWLTEDGDLIAITEPDRNKQKLRSMTPQQEGVVQITAIFLIPLVVFIAGLVVWWNRREGGTV